MTKEFSRATCNSPVIVDYDPMLQTWTWQTEDCRAASSGPLRDRWEALRDARKSGYCNVSRESRSPRIGRKKYL